MSRYNRSSVLRIILEELREAGGASRDKELYESVRREIPDLSFKEFLKYLLILEFNGCINVSIISENMRAVNITGKCSEEEKEE